MKRLILSLLMAVGMITSGFSQNIYPKKILWENDTIVGINREQLIDINRSLNDYIHLKRINENLQMDLRVSDSLCSRWKQIAYRNKALYDAEFIKYGRTCEVNRQIQEQLDKQKRKSRNIGIGVGVGSTLLGILIGVLLSK